MAYWAEGRAEDARYYLERCRGRAERLKLRRLGVEAELSLARVASAEHDPDARARLDEARQTAAELGYDDLRDEVAEILGNREK